MSDIKTLLLKSKKEKKEKKEKVESPEPSPVLDKVDPKSVGSAKKTREQNVLDLFNSKDLDSFKGELSMEDLFSTVWENKSLKVIISSERFAEVVLADAQPTYKLALLLGAAFGSLTISKKIEFYYNDKLYNVRFRKAFEQVKLTASGKQIEDTDVRKFGNKISSYACELVIKTMFNKMSRQVRGMNATVSNFPKVVQEISNPRALVTGHVKGDNASDAVDLFKQRCIHFQANKDVIKKIPNVNKFMGSNLALMLYINYEFPEEESKETYVDACLEALNKTVEDPRIKSEFYAQLKSRILYQRTKSARSVSYLRFIWGEVTISEKKDIVMKLNSQTEENLITAHNASVKDFIEAEKKKKAEKKNK